MVGEGREVEMRKFAVFESAGMFDHSLAIKLRLIIEPPKEELQFITANIAVAAISIISLFIYWLVLSLFESGAIKFFGSKRHHDKWLQPTEDFRVKGCFAMTELGHGSNHATHTIVFSQLYIKGENQGVHAFIVQIRDDAGNVCPNIRTADCGHKIRLNGVDNDRIWFDNVRIPRVKLLDSVADVTPDGQYISAIKDPDQRFAAFLAPLTSGRVGLATAISYSLSRRAFSIAPNEPEVLLLDYPSHQRRLLPLLAKTYAMSFAGNYLKSIYVQRTPEANKTIHILSSAFKATMIWHNMRTLQECREACSGQGLRTENLVGQLKSEYNVQSTFEGITIS
ncbi:Acyl-coenzyme A oxidase 3, peroxisomal-like protein [Drosera capensis]